MTDKTIHEKLVIIQSELKAPKGKKNGFGNYKYRSCEDILEAVKPLLKEQGLVLVISDEMIMLGDRFYVKATATLESIEKDYINTTAYAREAQIKKGMDESQITGAASSYARKYALNGLFLIDDTKDADAQEPPEEDKKPTVKPKKTQPPKANSYFDEWKAYIDKGIKLIDDTKDADAQEPPEEDKKPTAKPKKTQPPKANSYFDEWKAYIDKGIKAGYSDAVKKHIESITWLKKDDKIKVKEYYTNKQLQESKINE